MHLQALIFDLDGVITDTAEYHYQAWKRLADEEGYPFDRTINERLRGVARRASLEIILDGEEVDEARMAEMMARKNAYYVALLEQITPADLLPGAERLLRDLRAAGVKIAIGSASKNARTVLERLGILPLLDAVADGHSVSRTKPAPDVFLHAAQLLGVPPAACAVVEDAASGIEAALAAGMWAIGLGPEERAGHAHVRFDNLEDVTPEMIFAALEQASWTIAESRFDPERQHHKETIFTTGNGYQCIRGAFEEGFPGESSAAFIHCLWDYVPLHFSELANIPRWWGIDIWVNGERFRLDRGKVLSYRRELDMRTGMLSRRVRWQPEAEGPIVEFNFQRFANLAHPHQAALRLKAKVLSGEAEVRIRTGLNIHVENPLPAAPSHMGLVHWQYDSQTQTDDEVSLCVHTRESNIALALAAQVTVTTKVTVTASVNDADGQPAVERSAHLAAGETLTLAKYVGLCNGLEAEDPLAEAIAAARAARRVGFEELLRESAEVWAQTWEMCDVVIEGDIEAQIAMRFSLFQLLIAAPRWSEHASIGAKTLSGFGYRHHVFWDTEIFMLPMFIFTQPHLARNMLMYRYHNLPGARAKAGSNGYAGAQFPWESAGDGTEVTPTWVPHFNDPRQLVRIWTGDIEIHITADIAYGVMQYWQVTGDDEWMRDYGAEIVLDGANFWASAARLEEDGKYHFRNVIGPDEYHDRVDDNAYTNYMACWHLETALAVRAWLQETFPAQHDALVSQLDLSPERLSQWRHVHDHLYLPEDPETGLIEQFAGYFALEEPDFTVLRDSARTRSMQALLDIEGCQATQNIKQPDVLMLQYLLPQRFSPRQVHVNYDFYDPRTDHEHGSSLGPSVSAIMACRLGKPDDAYQHFMRAARVDLLDVRHNASDGIHGASAGGLWQAAVFGFGGLKIGPEGSSLEPRLPAHWSRLSFKFLYHGELQSVDLRNPTPSSVPTPKDEYRAVV